MIISRLKAKLAAVVQELSSCRERVRESLASTEKVNADLETIRSERSALEAERSKIEGASAVVLHRLSLTPAQAATKSDSIGKQAAAALSSEREAEVKVQGLKQSVSADLRRVDDLLKPFINEAELLSQAELIALLCSVVDPEQMDIPWSFEREQLNFFRHTFVHSIHAGRKSKLKAATTSDAVLALLDEILEEPTPTLARAAAVLPDSSQNSIIIRTLRQVVSQS